MSVHRLSPADAAWVVTLLERRRSRIRHLAPVFWKPAPDAAARHEEFLAGQLAAGRAVGYATEDSVLVAARGRNGLVVDDASVLDEAWDDGDGRLLWGALARDHSGEAVRFVCPAYEQERNAFAQALGLARTSTWWLTELEGAQYPPEDTEVDVPGAEAHLVGAPPVYEPGGPFVFLAEVSDAATALPAALEAARALRCAGVLVDQPTGDDALAAVLRESGLREQCHYYEGTL